MISKIFPLEICCHSQNLLNKIENYDILFFVEETPDMDQPFRIGEFEQLILLAILRLGPHAYGMRIRREIEEQTGRTTSIGALYITLERLEQKGFIKSELGESTPQR